MVEVLSLRQAQLQLIRGEVRSDLLARGGIGGIGKLGGGSGTRISISRLRFYLDLASVLLGAVYFARGGEVSAACAGISWIAFSL